MTLFIIATIVTLFGILACVSVCATLIVDEYRRKQRMREWERRLP